MGRGQKNNQPKKPQTKTSTSLFRFPEAEEMGEAINIQVVLPPLQSKFLHSWRKGS